MRKKFGGTHITRSDAAFGGTHIQFDAGRSLTGNLCGLFGDLLSFPFDAAGALAAAAAAGTVLTADAIVASVVAGGTVLVAAAAAAVGGESV